MTSKASEEPDSPMELSSEPKGPKLCVRTALVAWISMKLYHILQEDLQSILKEKNLKAPGSFAHSSILPFDPHPCLNIEGHGSIGLPLSEHEAKRVIAYASHAVYGQGVVNKKVRDTWEIDASRVKFDNPNWLTYIQDVAVSAVCSSLRLKKYDTPPRCQLYKLLIYETGSQ